MLGYTEPPFERGTCSVSCVIGQCITQLWQPDGSIFHNLRLCHTFHLQKHVCFLFMSVKYRKQGVSTVMKIIVVYLECGAHCNAGVFYCGNVCEDKIVLFV
jgi:hypothetical protein